MKSTMSMLGAVTLAASALACNPFAPAQTVVLPVSVIDAPATVAPSAAFTVTLTVQTGGCTTFDRIAVESDATGARLVPWGKNPALGRKDVACPQDIRYEPHAVQLKAGASDPFSIQVDQGRLAPLQATVRVQ
jgi:hypothetical protein